MLDNAWRSGNGEMAKYRNLIKDEFADLIEFQ